MAKTLEIWKPIASYEGYYEVSNLGRIRSVTRTYSKRVRNGGISIRTVKGRVLKPATNCPYLTVCLHGEHGRKTHAVHKLVALAFVPNTDNLPQINHKDEDKRNNRADNLEWCDASYNTTYGTISDRKRLKLNGEGNPHSCLTAEQVKEIRQSSSAGVPYETLAKLFGVSRDTIYQIVTRRRWKCVE